MRFTLKFFLSTLLAASLPSLHVFADNNETPVAIGSNTSSSDQTRLLSNQQGLPIGFYVDPDGPSGGQGFSADLIKEVYASVRYTNGSGTTSTTTAQSLGSDPLQQVGGIWHEEWWDFVVIFWTHKSSHTIFTPVTPDPEPGPGGPQPATQVVGGAHSCFSLENAASSATMQNARLSLSFKLEPNGATNNHDVDLINGYPVITVGQSNGIWLAFGITASDGSVIADSVTPAGSNPDSFTSQDANGQASSTNGSTFVVSLGTIAPGQTKHFALKMAWANSKERALWEFQNALSDPVNPC